MKMKKWDVELAYTLKVAVGIEASTQEEAIEKAKKCIVRAEQHRCRDYK